MRKRLPATKRLFASVMSKRGVSGTCGFIKYNRSFLKDYESSAELAIHATENPDDKQAQRWVESLTKVRGALAACLWGEKYFIGTTVLDELLFNASKSP